MRDVHLPALDLNLLPALEALLRQRNVTRAAAEVGLSQPAMSRALARLRAQFDDPLLVRRAKGMVLTPRGQALLTLAQSASSVVKDVFRAQNFMPETIVRTLRFAAADTHTVLLAPRLMARLKATAPGVSVQMEPYGPDLAVRLESGALDFAFALETTPLPPGAASLGLTRDRLALVMRRGHPLEQLPIRLADYAAFDHVGVALLGDGRSELDSELAAAGITRTIALVTPHFTAALAVVGATDMLTTVSRAYAQHFAAQFNLVLREPPLAHVEMRTMLVWAALRGADPFLVWAREQVRECTADIAYGGNT